MQTQQYTDWIRTFLQRFEHPSHCMGRCAEATEEMAKVFPELTRVRGHVHCMWGKRAHWWMTTPAGVIVDPTRIQFPGPIEYEPYQDGDEVLIGKCMDCGAELWGQPDDANPGFCSEECEAKTRAYLNSCSSSRGGE